MKNIEASGGQDIILPPEEEGNKKKDEGDFLLESLIREYSMAELQDGEYGTHGAKYSAVIEEAAKQKNMDKVDMTRKFAEGYHEQRNLTGLVNTLDLPEMNDFPQERKRLMLADCLEKEAEEIFNKVQEIRDALGLKEILKDKDYDSIIKEDRDRLMWGVSQKDKIKGLLDDYYKNRGMALVLREGIDSQRALSG